MARNTFQVTILGSSAATPTSLRHTSAQLLQHHNRCFLLDCAEGTQMQLRRFKLPAMRIRHVFISHLHGDHYLGLPGLLFTYHLLGRELPLHIYAPPGLEEIIEIQFRIPGLLPSFEIVYHTLERGGDVVYEDEMIQVETLEMQHRIPTYGFLFREKNLPRKLIKERLLKYRVPVAQMKAIKEGADYFKPDGTAIPNSELTLDPPPPRSYAFCSDTRYTENFLEQIRGVDLLYHEATFMNDRAETAREKLHATTHEAATLAKKAGVGQLLIGHYSARYKDIRAFEREAREVFPNSHIALEGQRFQVLES